MTGNAENNHSVKPIWMECEGSGSPAHPYGYAISISSAYGTCSMCGRTVLMTPTGCALLHERQDILAMIDRGDFG